MTDRFRSGATTPSPKRTLPSSSIAHKPPTDASTFPQVRRFASSLGTQEDRASSWRSASGRWKRATSSVHRSQALRADDVRSHQRRPRAPRRHRARRRGRASGFLPPMRGDECKPARRAKDPPRDPAGRRARAGVYDRDALDCVITNALVIDARGILQAADVGIKGVAACRGNQERSPATRTSCRGYSRDDRWASTTEAIAGEGLILTAGGITSHTSISFVPSRLTRRSRLE